MELKSAEDTFRSNSSCEPAASAPCPAGRVPQRWSEEGGPTGLAEGPHLVEEVVHKVVLLDGDGHIRVLILPALQWRRQGQGCSFSPRRRGTGDTPTRCSGSPPTDSPRGPQLSALRAHERGSAVKHTGR